MKFIKEIILFFIPRFVTDNVALARDHDGNLQVYCLTEQVEPEDKLYIETYGVCKTFTWFGLTTGGWCLVDEEVKVNNERK